MQVKIKRQKSLKYLILTTSPDKHGIPAPEEFLNWKNPASSHVLKNTFSNLSRHYNYWPANIWYYYTLYPWSIFFLAKILQLILEINATYRLVSYLLRAMHDSAQLITLASTLIIPDITKTESNNCLIIRKSKALKFNHRPSKLEKINRQPSKQTLHWDPLLRLQLKLFSL